MYLINKKMHGHDVAVIQTPGVESRVRFKVPETHKSSRKTFSTKPPSKVAKLSFEDYHITWSGIATSKARPDLKNPCK